MGPSGDFQAATSKGAIATIVVGKPFSEQPNSFEDAVRALMKDQVGHWPIRFVSRHGANTTPPYKVVVVFNPRPNADERTICQRESRTPRDAGNSGALSVVMVFCDGNNPKSSSSGRVGDIQGRGDPTFAALVRGVTAAIIPPAGRQQQRQYAD